MPRRLNDEDAVAIMRAANLEPLVPYPGADKPWECICQICRQKVSPHYGSIKNGGGCGVCAGKIVIPKLAEKVMKKAKLKPLVPYPGAKKHWKSECLRCHRIVSPTYGDVRLGEGGCKYCGKKYVDPTEAFKFMKSMGLYPQVPYPGNSIGWHCTCENCGKNIYPVYNTVKGRGTGCKYCKKVYVDALDAEALMRKNNLEPLVPYPGSRVAWKCRCLICGKTVSPQHGAIASGQGACKYCARKVVDPIDAVTVMLKNRLEPLEPYSKSDGPWKCRCLKCGKTVTPAYVAVNGGQGGCKYCAVRGIDYSASAFLYLISHPKLGAHKIGIGTDKTKNHRLSQHKRDGWLVYKTISFDTAEDAEKAEQRVLKWLRITKGLGIYLTQGEMPRGGYSETVDASEIDLPTIWAEVLKRSKVKR